MLKKMPCPDCNGNGFVSQFTECSVTGKKCSACDGLGHVEVPQTNADLVRAMGDEELAELFYEIVDNGKSCELICADHNKCLRNNATEPICQNHYLNWLKQPAEGE